MMTVISSVVLAAMAATGPSGVAFYIPPNPLPAGAHGDVIWARPLTTGAALPSAASNTLVLYRTMSLSGADVAVSGTISVPKGTPPKGGWPVISWAHGTTGDAPKCTPSLDSPSGPEHRYLGQVEPALDQAVARGYAVVQTDYEGQGTPGPTPYLIGVAEARDAIDMVRAARQIVPQLSTSWVVMGHSQGGQTVLFTSATAAQWAPELHLIGAVAEAPAAFISVFIGGFPKQTTPTAAYAFAALFMDAAAAFDPSVKLDQLLTPAALAMVPQLHDQCVDELATNPTGWGSIVPASSFRTDAVLAPLLKFATTNDAGGLHPTVPIMLAQGSADTIVPKASSDAIAGILCGNGATIHYNVYQGIEHEPLVMRASDDALTWVGARFAGQPAPTNCGGAPTLH